jgi:hypothetical protein
MSLITRAVSNGIEWGITSSVAGAVSGKIKDFAQDRTTHVTHTRKRTMYSTNGRNGHSESFGVSETYVLREPSKLSKLLKTAKKKVNNSFSKLKSAIQKK